MKKMFTAALLAIAVGWAWSGATFAADDYPTRPIRVLNQFGPGGGADLTGRPVLDKLGGVLGTSVLMDFKPGASGLIAAAEFEKSAPDGYTLLIETQTLSNNTLLRKVPYRPAEWEPLSLFAIIPLGMLAAQNVPARNLAELVDHARKNQGKLTYGTLGPGSISHLAALLFAKTTGTEWLQVPYKGTTEVHQDLMGGRLDIFFDGVSQALPLQRDGRLKIMGLTTEERIPLAGNIPTFKEQGINISTGSWFGFVAPKGTPRTVTSRLSREIAAYVTSGEYQEKMKVLGVIAIATTAQEYAEFRRNDLRKWEEVIKQHNLRLE